MLTFLITESLTFSFVSVTELRPLMISSIVNYLHFPTLKARKSGDFIGLNS